MANPIRCPSNLYNTLLNAQFVRVNGLQLITKLTLKARGIGRQVIEAESITPVLRTMFRRRFLPEFARVTQPRGRICWVKHTRKI